MTFNDNQFKIVDQELFDIKIVSKSVNMGNIYLPSIFQLAFLWLFILNSTFVMCCDLNLDKKYIFWNS
jgi:hypothetical protein